jgi:hypothetical protein
MRSCSATSPPSSLNTGTTIDKPAATAGAHAAGLLLGSLAIVMLLEWSLPAGIAVP